MAERIFIFDRHLYRLVVKHDDVICMGVGVAQLVRVLERLN